MAEYFDPGLFDKMQAEQVAALEQQTAIVSEAQVFTPDFAPISDDVIATPDVVPVITDAPDFTPSVSFNVSSLAAARARKNGRPAQHAPEQRSVKEVLRSGYFKAAGALGVIALTAATMLGHDHSSANAAPHVRTSPSVSRTITPIGPNALVSDNELLHGGFDCGETDTLETGPSFNASSQIGFLNNTPELVKNLGDFVNDPTWGNGEAAEQVLAQFSITNPNTPASAQVQGSADLNTAMHQLFSVELNEDHSYVNFTCDDGNGNQVPIHVAGNITTKVTTHVLGRYLDADGLAAYEKVVNRNEDGQPVTEILDRGMQTINGKTFHAYFVTEYANGCHNPIRVIPTKPPVTPSESPTPTSAPSPTPSTTAPYIPPKKAVPLPGPHTQPGAGGSPESGAINDNPGDGYNPTDDPNSPSAHPTTPEVTPSAPRSSTPEENPRSTPSGGESTPGTAPTAPTKQPPSYQPSVAPTVD